MTFITCQTWCSNIFNLARKNLRTQTMAIKLSIFGALGLLGQHLMDQVLCDPDLEIVSLHDHRHKESLTDLPWFAGPEAREFALKTPIFSPTDTAPGDLILSFLPDSGAEEIEKQHLQNGAHVVSHCEYARHQGSLLMPGVQTAAPQDETLWSTPNCTTAMCALPLALLHKKFGIEAVHATTLQAISGTDLPGMPAYLAQDHVISPLDGEARALERELALLFDNSFPVSCAATRVPVWRSHTISLMIKLRNNTVKADDLAQTLSRDPKILVTSKAPLLPPWQIECVRDDLLCAIDAIQPTSDGWFKISLRGDNLGQATTGLMASLAKALGKEQAKRI
ncbi:hypothetical protein KMP13_02115 [Epibacterium ulvae]|uniref:hypothetical protein n=1 Tax=Epibacterium ulvae TaxID=1156985 RepID=UPI001BFBF729|nr:hypothetical protein [Epibacterium ulvae]MBT8152710.1 hypothetical protein [Epibacterium ulvae]